MFRGFQFIITSFNLDEKILTEKKPRGKVDILLYYTSTSTNEDLFRPFNKAQLSKAAKKMGGDANDTAYFYQEDGHKIK